MDEVKINIKGEVYTTQQDVMKSICDHAAEMTFGKVYEANKSRDYWHDKYKKYKSKYFSALSKIRTSNEIYHQQEAIIKELREQITELTKHD